MSRAFGIVNFAGNNIQGNPMQAYRPTGAISFLGRYRVIDFPISNMSNSGIDSIQVYIRRKPRSLVEHLGTGRHYNINSKRGNLNLLFCENGDENSIYSTDLAAYVENLDAIEEFQRVNERYTYLTDQRDDVLKSKKELEGIIADITEEMKTIFARQFSVINEAFQQTFTELFGGGKATLELEEPEDILNCGIEIRVQPPGKALKVLSLLSGGEKAFVAIALYFAILKVRPTPFCVMDEIEAALDDANVVRFARYMRQMADKTQFIVITHRRGTMEEADVLYGVTMQEQGVSRILTINLNDVEKELHIK